MVLLMFVIGILPAAFAQEAAGPVPIVIDASSDRVGVQSVPTRQAVAVEAVALRPIKVSDAGSGSVAGSGQPTSGIGAVEVTPISIENVDSDVEKTKRKRHIDGLINRNKGKIRSIFNSLKNNYDEDKAIKFVTFAAHVNERAIDVVERMMERAEESPKFLENHPNAIERMEEVRGELYESYEIFYGAVSDGAMSEEEYMALTDELKEFGKKLKRFSQNEKVRAYAKNHREEITKNLRDRYGKNPKVNAGIERLENARDAKERKAAMDEVRTSVIEVSSDRVSVELAEDTPVATATGQGLET